MILIFVYFAGGMGKSKFKELTQRKGKKNKRNNVRMLGQV